MAILLEKLSKIHKICGSDYKTSSQFEENSKINISSLVPQIDHSVALCSGYWVQCTVYTYITMKRVAVYS